MNAGRAMLLHPIGHLETPFHTLADCPRNGRQPDPPPLCRAVVDAQFVPGLQGLDGISHLILLYWLPREVWATDSAPPLVFTPRFGAAPCGVFAARTPARPNPIGLSVVAFEGMEAPGRLLVRYLDCVDGTVLLDIKPYLPTTDAEPAATVGWLAPYVRQPG